MILLLQMFILVKNILWVKYLKKGTADVIPHLKEYYNIDFNVPLDTEIKIGYNWLDMKEVEII